MLLDVQVAEEVSATAVESLMEERGEDPVQTCAELCQAELRRLQL